MRTQPYWLHDQPWLKQGVWLIRLGVVGGVAMLIWMLISTAVLPEPTFDADFERTPTGGNISVRDRCPECGVVSATREITHVVAGANSGIEVTVRMKDGSMRQFVDASSSVWRVGERMIIIDSANQAGD